MFMATFSSHLKTWFQIVAATIERLLLALTNSSEFLSRWIFDLRHSSTRWKFSQTWQSWRRCVFCSVTSIGLVFLPLGDREKELLNVHEFHCFSHHDPHDEFLCATATRFLKPFACAPSLGFPDSPRTICCSLSFLFFVLHSCFGVKQGHQTFVDDWAHMLLFECGHWPNEECDGHNPYYNSNSVHSSIKFRPLLEIFWHDVVGSPTEDRDHCRLCESDGCHLNSISGGTAADVKHVQ